MHTDLLLSKTSIAYIPIVNNVHRNILGSFIKNLQKKISCRQLHPQKSKSKSLALISRVETCSEMKLILDPSISTPESSLGKFGYP